MAKVEEELQSVREQLAKRDAQLERMIAVMEARIAPPPQLSEDAKVAQLVDDLNGVARSLPRERQIPIKSEVTGGTFQARVVESRGFPEGRIVDLVDYKYPAGYNVKSEEGGLIPRGLKSHRDDNGHPLTIYKQWLWAEFWKKDLIEYVGKPMSSRYGDITIAWTQPVARKRGV